MIILNALVLIGLGAFMTGCAGGRSYDYTAIPVEAYLDGDNKEITLGVHDQREYVKSGEKYPQYVGTQRSVAYVPWNINTKSGSPMADDFLFNIGKSLESDGFKVNSVALSEKENKKQVMVRLKENGDNRLLLFTINEWYFDVHFWTRMSYSMKLEIFNREGKLLAYAEAKKEMWDEKDNAIPDLEFKSMVETLLTNDKIVKGLNPNLKYSEYEINTAEVEGIIVKDEVPRESIGAAVEKEPETNQVQQSTEEKTKCTTDQILKMKEMGMADNQIKAACD